MNSYTQESFQKYERKRSKHKCADQYDTGESANKRKQGYSSQRSLKRNWEQEA
jgi:hypothetical protein